MALVGTGRALLSGVAPWAMRGSALDIDFTHSRAAVNQKPVSLTGLLTTTRASTGYAATSSGLLVSFLSNVPRITDLGLLVEQAATNLALQSQALGTTWVAENSTITVNNSAAPDGTTTGNLHTENTSSATHDIFQSGITLTGSATYTTSVWAKAGTNRYVYLNVQGNSGVWYTAVFDLQGGGTTATQTGAGATSGTVTSTSQTAYINGWYRLTLTGSGTMTSTTIVIGQANAATGNTLGSTNGQISYLGSSRTVSLWGAQLELGSFATSYIPTTTVSVTRAADAVTFNNLSLPAPYSFFISVGSSAKIDSDLLLGGTNTNASGLYGSGGSALAFVMENSVTTANVASSGTFAANTAFKLAGRFSVNDVNASLNGGIGTHDTSTTPPTLAALGFGRAAVSGGFGSSVGSVYFKRATLFRSGLSDAQLQAIST